MGLLGTGKQSNWRRLSHWSRFSEFHIDALVAQELHYLSPMKASLPVSPKYRMRSRWRDASSGAGEDSLETEECEGRGQ
ncbi:hypothetical protein KSD_80480 [Ktedonobacter sp. SOSP1-85]|nr:hypothetical protein KSD_80480 [Ktedonobacter sp. SOSP1-85]